jgi:hypothetical protein
MARMVNRRRTRRGAILIRSMPAMPTRAPLVLFAVLAGCPADDARGTLDGSLCDLGFDDVDAVRGSVELAVRYKRGTEIALSLNVADASQVQEGEAIALRPPTGTITRSEDGTLCELPDPCAPEVGPAEVTFSTFEDRAGGSVVGDFLACFADGTNAHGSFDTELTVF